MKITVIVPFCPDGGQRDANYSWVTKRLRKLLPDAEILVPTQNTLPFNKSAAVNKAAKMASNDILMVCDADIAFDMDLIKNSLEIVNDVPWISPFCERWDLTHVSTNEVLKAPCDVEMKSFGIDVKRKYKEVRCRAGSVFIMTKKNFYKVGGFDERFAGWGFEDSAFELAARYTIGDCAEIDNIVYHLWHPLGDNQFPHHTEWNRLLYEEYIYHFVHGDLPRWLKANGKWRL